MGIFKLNIKYHKIIITLASIIVLSLGVYLGNYLSPSNANAHLEAAKIGLLFTTIFILLIFGSYVLDIKKILESKNKR